MEHTGIAVGDGEVVDEAGCLLEGLEVLGSVEEESELLVGFDLVNWALEGVVEGAVDAVDLDDLLLWALGGTVEDTVAAVGLDGLLTWALEGLEEGIDLGGSLFESRWGNKGEGWSYLELRAQ